MSPILSRKLSLLAIALPMLAGCIEWDHQEVRYRYDAKADRLRIFQNYEGIYGADKKDSLSSSERSQLKSVLAGGRTFFFANWIVEINLPEVKGAVHDLRFKGTDSVAEDELNRALSEMQESLVKNCTIENGSFYLNSKGQLSAVQTVEIRNWSKLLPLVEKTLGLFYKHSAQNDEADADQVAHYERVRQGWKFFNIKGNAFEAKFPGTQAEFDKTFSADGRKKMKEAGIHVSCENDTIVFRFGKSGDTITKLAMDPFKKSYRANLHEHLKGKQPIEETLDVEKAAKKFLR